MNGQLFRISDFANQANGFWIGVTANARGQYTQEFSWQRPRRQIVHLTVSLGALKSIQTGVGGGTGVQNLAYQWDKTGNLKQRKDINQSNLTEDFFYDNLHRLDYSNRNGVLNLDMSYDALGNIATKSDVGTYTYHADQEASGHRHHQRLELRLRQQRQHDERSWRDDDLDELQLSTVRFLTERIARVPRTILSSATPRTGSTGSRCRTTRTAERRPRSMPADCWRK